MVENFWVDSICLSQTPKSPVSLFANEICVSSWGKRWKTHGNYLFRSPQPMAPSDCPSSGLPSLHKLRHCPVGDSRALELFNYITNRTQLAEHAGIPLATLFKNKAFVYHTADKLHFATRRHHLDLGTRASAVGRPRLGCCTGKKIFGIGVEGRVAHCEVDTKMECYQ